MDPLVGAALVSGGSNLLGGLLGGSSGPKAPSFEDQKGFARSVMREQFEVQREFAKNSVRWKVEDAIAAGLHPLAALGAQTWSPSASVGMPSIGGNAPSDRGEFISRMGQDLSRAISSTRTQGERAAAQAATALSLERGQLENDLLRSQIAKLNSAQIGPPFPGDMGTRPVIGGQSGAVEVVPTMVSPRYRKDNVQVGGSNKPFYQLLQTPIGPMAVPSDDWLRMQENNPIMIPQWYGASVIDSAKRAGQEVGRRIGRFFRK